MVDIIDEINKLTEEWYFLIGKDHHKDRDCHWYIETSWSYGYPPKYNVQHRGYVLGTIDEEFSSYDEAVKGLRDLLLEKIEQEKKNQKENEDPDC